MLRLVGFFFAVLVLLQVLRAIPGLNVIFDIPILGFWLAAILLAGIVSRLASDALDRRKRNALVRQLGAVETPHNMGKLGSLFAAQRRFRHALPYLEKAAAGEPDVAEWHYRLGTARLGTGDVDGAIDSLAAALRINEEHAYGAVVLRYAEALTRNGDADGALEALERFERNHGPNPESAYRRGVALKSAGRRDEARASFAEVSQLAEKLAKYQRSGSTGWVFKAFFARFV